MTAAAAAGAVVGWPSARWWRRGLSVLVVPLRLLCVGLALNRGSATSPRSTRRGRRPPRRRCPTRSPTTSSPRCRGTCRRRPRPRRRVSTPRHRQRLRPPRRVRLAAARLVRRTVAARAAGRDDDRGRVQHARRLDAHRERACRSIDAYAAAHGGQAPILVFVDAAARSTTTPSASTAREATPPTTSPRTSRPYVISPLRRVRATAPVGRRRLVDGRHLRGRSRRDAPGAVRHASTTSPVTPARGRAPRHRRSRSSTAATPPRGPASTRSRCWPGTPHTPTPRAGSPTPTPLPAARHSAGRGPSAHLPGTRSAAGGTGLGGQADTRDTGNQIQEATQLCTAMTTDGITCTQHTLPVGTPGRSRPRASPTRSPGS